MSLAEIYKVVEEVSAFSTLIPLGICFLRFKFLNRSAWAFFCYLLLCISIDRLSLMNVDNEPLMNALANTFTVLEGALICFIYYNEFYQKGIKKVISFALLLFLSFSLFIFGFKGAYTQNDSLVSPVEACIIIALAGLYLRNFLLDDRITEIRGHYFYWINLAFLLYFSTALLLFLNRDFLASCSDTTNYILWGLHLILNIVTNILSAIGIWNTKQKLRY